jgi:hypothetical protein
VHIFINIQKCQPENDKTIPIVEINCKNIKNSKQQYSRISNSKFPSTARKNGKLVNV